MNLSDILSQELKFKVFFRFISDNVFKELVLSLRASLLSLDKLSFYPQAAGVYRSRYTERFLLEVLK